MCLLRSFGSLLLPFTVVLRQPLRHGVMLFTKFHGCHIPTRCKTFSGGMFYASLNTLVVWREASVEEIGVSMLFKVSSVAVSRRYQFNDALVVNGAIPFLPGPCSRLFC